MRTKTRATKARVSKIPPNPSKLAIPLLNLRCVSEARPSCSRGNASNLPEKSNRCSVERTPQLSPTSSGEMVKRRKRSRRSGSWDEPHQESMELEWTGQSMCIKCSGGGQVLVCSDHLCGLAVHEKCMNSSAAFDDMGNFYCPYCWYRRAIVKCNEARKIVMSSKKALSTFLDAKLRFRDQRKQRAEQGNAEVPNKSQGMRNRHCNEDEHWLDDNEVHDRSVKAKKDQQVGHQLHTKSSVDGGGGDSLCSREGGIISAEWSSPAFLSNKKSDRMKQFKAVNIREMIQEEDSRKVGVSQDEGVAKDQQEAEPLNACNEEGGMDSDDAVLSILTKRKQGSARITEENHGKREKGEPLNDFPVEEGTDSDDILVSVLTKRKLDNTKMTEGDHDRRKEEAESLNGCHVEEGTDSDDVLLSVLTRKKPDNAKITKKNHGMVEEQMQPQVQETPAALTHQRAVVQRNRKEMEPQNMNLQNKSSSKLDTNAAKHVRENKELLITSKSIQARAPSKQLTNRMFPNEKRKKLSWKAEEEEMLKEGVHKFSATGYKNLPWRKILEFGHHIFDGTRTPVDLKDKWRNMLAKNS